MPPDLDPHEFARLADALHGASLPARTATQVLGFAVQQLEADHGSIVLLRRGRRLETIAATDPQVERIDELQAELGEGPCREAEHGEAMVAVDLRSDQRWRRWGPKVADLGVASLLGVQFTTYEGRSAGSINLSWREPRVFVADDIAFTDIFARHAALALSASLEIAGLNVALDGRKLHRSGPRHPHGTSRPHRHSGLRGVLRRYSQDHNLKLRQVAEHLVATRSLPPPQSSSRD